MRSIFARAMGADFARLHPKVQQWFGLTSADGLAAHGRGTLERVWRGGWYTLPFLWVGAMRNIMCPEQGERVPFTVENYAFRDACGDETTAIIRTFRLERKRRFDEYMVATDAPGRVVNYLGTHQHLAVDLDLSVGPNGDMCIRSGTQRIIEGPLRFRFPRLFSANADVSIGYCDARSVYRIDAMAANPLLGPVFAYGGTFQVEWRKVTPEDILNASPTRMRPSSRSIAAPVDMGTHY